MSTTAGDLRYALRSMRANPGFTAIAVASLALGIGVNTAIFSLVDQLLLWSVPARDPAQLVSIDGGRSGTYPFYREYRDRNRVFSGLLASSQAITTGIRPEDAPAVETGRVNYISGNYFQTLGAGAAAGRVITPADDLAPGGSPVAVLSYSYWQRRFAGNVNIVGHRLTVNGAVLEVAGIAEKGFGGLFNGQQVDVFIPVTMYPITTPATAPAWNTPGMHWLFLMGRLKPGISIEQAQAAMRVLWPVAAEAVNGDMVRRGGKRRDFKKEEQIVLTSGVHGFSGRRNEMLDPLRILIAATGLVLLIACANVANLLLARSTSRRREIAVRLAVGASRGRLVRQLLSESLLLAAIGGAAGFAFAYTSVLLFAEAGVVDPGLRFRPSFTVAAFSGGVTLVTGILFGLAPAFRSTRVGLSDAMKDSGSATQGGSRLRVGKALVAGQVALSLALLVGAGLFIRTLRNLRSADVGFQRENIVIVDVDPTTLGYNGHRLRTFYDQLLERARRVRGVRSAALATMTPMGSFARSRTFSAEGYQPKPGEQLIAFSNPVSSGYFTTLGIPMLLGRDFRPQDEPAVTPRDNFMATLGRGASGGSSDMPPEHGSHVCIINESLARRLFGGANPVGRRLSYDDVYTAASAIDIVGVVKDVHHWDARTADDIGIIYVPAWGDGAEARWLALRVTGDPAPSIAATRRELRNMDPNVPVLHTSTLEEYVNATMKRERLIAYLSSFFGILALGLASVGLYGLMAYSVTRRTREVGIRMALGATRAEIVGMILRESAVAVFIGIVLGLVAALAFARFIAAMLYGVAPRDPVSIGIAALVMLGVALFAAAIPARRASRVEPLTALRHE